MNFWGNIRDIHADSHLNPKNSISQHFSSDYFTLPGRRLNLKLQICSPCSSITTSGGLLQDLAQNRRKVL